MKHFPTCIAVFVLFVAACPVAGLAQHATGLAEPPKLGGYARASVRNKEVVAAAAFAIKAQEKAGGKTTKPELVKILRAESQVVAGTNYRLTLKVKLSGKERTAEAIVYRPLKKGEPDQLTSWNWK